MKKLLHIFIIVLFVFISTAVFAAEIKFELSLDRTKIGIGERAQLGLAFRDTQSMPAPDLGKLDGLEIRYLGPSTMMTVINGQVSSSVTHLYSILPLRIGTFQIGPYTFNYKGHTYISNMTSLEVVEGAVPQQKAPAQQQISRGSPMAPGAPPKLDDRIFLTLASAKASAYVNELVPVTVKMRVNRLNVNEIQLPSFEQEGFSKVAFKEPKQYRETMDGTQYEVLEFNTAIFGMRPGEYKLGPAKLKCTVMLPKHSTQRYQDEFFDNQFDQSSMFDDFFGRFEKYPVELKSQELQVVILPLPEEGRPKDFSGAVGDFQFILDANPVDKLKVGDPITVTMTINGTGNMNTVLVPKLEDTTGYRLYESQAKTEEGRKIFKQVIIPESEKVTRLPKAVFTYFDPNKKEYKTITHGGAPIAVEKSKDEPPAQVIGPAPSAPMPGEEKVEAAKDIIYIKEQPGLLRPRGGEIYQNRWLAFIFPLPLLVLFLAHILIVWRTALSADVIRTGRVAARRALRQGGRDLRRAIKDGNAKAFYELIFKTLQDYLGAKLLIPAVGITSDVAEDMLKQRDVDADTLKKMRDLFLECDMARFGQVAIDAYKMHEDLGRMETIIRAIEKKKI